MNLARRLALALFAFGIGVGCYHHGHLPPPAAETVDGKDVDAAWLREFSAKVHDAQPQLDPCKDDDCLCTVLCGLKPAPPPGGRVEVTFPGHPSGVGVQVDEKGAVVKCFYNAADGESEIDDCPWKTF